jgi:hypothetical protein
MKRRFVFAAASLAASLVLISMPSQAKTVKACEEEWKANKAAIQASGKKKVEFVAECRAETAAAEPTAQAQAPQPAPRQTAAPKEQAPAQQPAPRETNTAEQPRPAPAPRRTAKASLSVGEYASEAEAKAHCPGDDVVWANTRSKIYHFAGTADYGRTKMGAYMCERETASAGIRAAKNERRR